MNQSEKDELIDIVIDAMAELEETEAALRSAKTRFVKLSFLLERQD